MNDNSSTNKKRVNIHDDGSELASEPRNDGRERSGERVLTRKAKLLWVDLEMTGLDPVKDKILEVAAIATDMDLNQIATYEAVIKVDENLMKERMVGDFWEKNKKSYNALMAQNKDGKPVETVENELLDFVKENFGTEIYLAGNSIHQDRKFIEREMPTLNSKLHYRMLDV
ncbi:oligoribonuclease, partial [Candidatus Saccharibacteria bacterium]|nr:oligoribonuclease [Candidatus Saccharibacteria bacterium]